MRDWFATIALVILFIVAGLEAIFIKHNADVVDALQAQNQALQVSSAQVAGQYNVFFRTFIRAQIFECDVDVALAKKNLLYPPPADVCQITAP